MKKQYITPYILAILADYRVMGDSLVELDNVTETPGEDWDNII